VEQGDALGQADGYSLVAADYRQTVQQGNIIQMVTGVHVVIAIFFFDVSKILPRQ